MQHFQSHMFLITQVEECAGVMAPYITFIAGWKYYEYG